jgi:hypothetical protein
MNVTDARLASTRTPIEAQAGAHKNGTAADGDHFAGARLFVSDVEHVVDDARIAYHLADRGWELVVARVFGVPREDQSVLVKVLLTGALATVAGGYVSRPHPALPSRGDTAMGASVLNAAVRGLAGAPSQTIPAAGALIGLAVLAHSIRSAVAGSSRDVQRLTHGAEARYGHRSPTSVAADRTAPG